MGDSFRKPSNAFSKQQQSDNRGSPKVVAFHLRTKISLDFWTKISFLKSNIRRRYYNILILFFTHTQTHTECTQLESHAQTDALHEILRYICCATNGLSDTISLCWLLLSWFALTGMTQIVLFSSTWQVQESRWEMLHHSCPCYLRSQVFAKNIIANSALQAYLLTPRRMSSCLSIFSMS